MIELKLNTRRGGFHLQVECRFAADWTVIFGPSGAGKSTLLRLLAGLDRDNHIKGRVIFDGRTFTDTDSCVWLKPGARETGFVVQQSALFPHLNVAANVAFGIHRLEKAQRERRIDEMLELVDARELASRRIQDLSGGQAQRIALARALAAGPRLLLLDEPFSALDGVASDALLDRLQEWLRRNRVQSVLATHDVTDALAIGAEVLLLDEGRQVALGTAAEVLAPERLRILKRLD
jgi:ABC-type sulfate/molybdate transport systems ATPase subunit